MDFRMGRQMDKHSNGMMPWNPSVDIRENGNNMVVVAEVPGCKKEDLHVTLKDGMLSISGEKKQEKDKKEDKHHRMERTYGCFVRSFYVGNDVKEDQIQAKLNEGCLEITFPKPKQLEKEQKKITIQ